MSTLTRPLPPGAATLLLVPSLGLLTGGPVAAAGVLHRTTTSGATDPFAPVLAAVGLLAWLGTGWLALVLVLDLGARLPGVVGRGSARALPHVAPATVRLLVRGATGLLLTGAALSATSPALANDRPSPGPLTARTAAALDAPRAPVTPADLDWPIAAQSATAFPTAPSPTPATAPSTGPARTPAPSIPALAAPLTPAAGPVYVVVPGDSLWAIASRALSTGTRAPSVARVAASWPSWWQTNRAVIGADPDLLLPGTPLLPPTVP